MNIEDFEKSLLKLKDQKNGFDFKIYSKIDLSDFENFERKTELLIPEKIKEFYSTINGFETMNPSFKMLPMKDWQVNENGLIRFATFNELEEVVFDSKSRNSAGQWSIIHRQSGYEITLSLSSFWSNKIWQWIKNEKKIWKEDYWM